MSSLTEAWNSFTLRVPIKASIGTLYKAWTTQQGLESWFLRKAAFTQSNGSPRQADSFIQKGDTYHWLWHGYGDETFEKNPVIDANGKDLLQFIFTGNCLVTVHIKEERSEVLCELKQENIPLDSNPETNLVLGCSGGWTFYLANLKSILEGGIDLRNRNENLKRVINS